ncbi:MAG: hypothetical protein IPO56_06120 [Flavobacteriales bacterium]|nr:hypothetical protein [Flavobacteriales bacterium]
MGRHRQRGSRFHGHPVRLPSESTGSLGAFDIAVPVFHRNKPLAFLLIGDIDEEEQRMSPTVKHLNFIQTLTNLIVVALENRLCECGTQRPLVAPRRRHHALRYLEASHWA